MPRPWNKVNIPKETLKDLYENQRLSIAQIAEKLGYSTRPIHRLLREYKLKIRTISEAKEKFKISKRELRALYQRQKLSMDQISHKFGCSRANIVYRMKKYRIKSRGHLGLTKPIRVSKEKLKYLYKKRGLSLAKIARIIHRSEGGIERKFKTYGIRSRGLDNRASKYKKRNFDGNLLEKAYMIGFRLGDLNVFSPKNIICVRCSSTKKAQIRLIRNLFKKYGGIYQALAPRGTFEICCFLNKSFEFLLPKEDKIPRWILSNNHLFLPFFSGYVDAEGCIHVRTHSGGRKTPFGGLEITSYDKHILQQSWKKLLKVGIISPKPLLVKPKGSIDKRGFKQNGDAWRLNIYRKDSVWRLLGLIQPYIKHAEKIKAIETVKKNIVLRNKIPYCHKIDLSLPKIP